MKTFRNGGKMSLALNLPGRSVHLRPKGTVELDDQDVQSSEAMKHIAKGRLVLVEKKASPVVPKAPVKTKVAAMPMPANKPADAEKNDVK